MVGIYKITASDGCIYIGQSKEIIKRFSRYKYIKKIKKQPLIDESILKYGFENHIFEVIHELPDDVGRNVLDQYEQLYIELYQNCLVGLLNIREGGWTGKQSPLTKEKLVKINTGIKQSEETKEKLRIANIGKKYSEETNRKKGIANIGKPRSKETKEKISKAHIGKSLSESTKQKLREANVGKKVNHSQETRNKISVALSGKKVSDQARQNMSKAQLKNPNRYWLGKKRGARSHEEKERISAGLKLAWQHRRRKNN